MTFTSEVGLLTTIGLSAKNAILIVEFAKDLMDKEGKGIIEATLEASRMRLRPILMTSPAFILGVMPLVISSGAGSGAQNAVGTGVMGGMLSATPVGHILCSCFLCGCPETIYKAQGLMKIIKAPQVPFFISPENNVKTHPLFTFPPLIITARAFFLHNFYNPHKLRLFHVLHGISAVVK